MAGVLVGHHRGVIVCGTVIVCAVMILLTALHKCH